MSWEIALVKNVPKDFQNQLKREAGDISQFIEITELTKLKLVGCIGELFFSRHYTPPVSREILDFFEARSMIEPGKFVKSLLFRSDVRKHGLVGEGLVNICKRGRMTGFYPSALIYKKNEGEVLLDFARYEQIDFSDNLVLKNVFVKCRGGKIPLIAFKSSNVSIPSLMEVARAQSETSIELLDFNSVQMMTLANSVRAFLNAIPPIPGYLVKQSFRFYRLLKDMEAVFGAILRCISDFDKEGIDRVMVYADIQNHFEEYMKLIESFEKLMERTDLNLLFELTREIGEKEEFVEAYHVATFLPNELQIALSRTINLLSDKNLSENDKNNLLGYRFLLSEVRANFGKYLYRSCSSR